MTGYLKRLVNSLAAYQVADLVSKFMAVLLLPVYTRYIAPAGYGVVELLGNGVILISILVRFGMIESFRASTSPTMTSAGEMCWRADPCSS